jgi:homoserine dehydrogenase
VADALDAAVSISNRVYWPHSIRRETSLKTLPIDEINTRYYLRISVADRPGVLGHVAGALGDAGISIASLIQKDAAASDAHAEIVIMTHEAKESDLRRAMESIAKIDGVDGVLQTLRVLS